MLRAWWLSFRPKTLTAAIIPVVVGTALALRAGEMQWWISAFAIASALMIQVGTNLFNDALDFKKGADGEDRLGPKRVTASGMLSLRQVMGMAFLSFALAAALGIPLVIHGGWPIVAIGIISLFCGYAYTGGPFPLAYKGLGDLFVVIFFGWVAVGGVVYLHTGSWSLDALVAGTQVGFLCTVLIAINNLRDVVGDTRVNKKTLAVRLGKTFVRREILFLFLGAFLLNFYWLKEKEFWAFGLSFLALPLAVKILKQVFQTEPSEVYNSYLAQAAGVHILFGFLFSFGLFLSGSSL